MFGCNTHLLKHIKQAILAWSFRQNIILGCYPVFAAISARGEFIVLPYIQSPQYLHWMILTMLTVSDATPAMSTHVLAY